MVPTFGNKYIFRRLIKVAVMGGLVLPKGVAYWKRLGAAGILSVKTDHSGVGRLKNR